MNIRTPYYIRLQSLEVGARRFQAHGWQLIARVACFVPTFQESLSNMRCSMIVVDLLGYRKLMRFREKQSSLGRASAPAISRATRRKAVFPATDRAWSCGKHQKAAPASSGVAVSGL